jgi:DNA-binding NarL/FixJ family response regulator
MDVSMPGMDGIKATRKLKAEFPETSVLILTVHADHRLLMEAIKAGAAGYVLKGGSSQWCDKLGEGVETSVCIPALMGE